MKLNWFCPLPPAKTSIADDYLVGILPALSNLAELTLWTNQNKWDSDLEKLASVRQYQPDRMSWSDLNQADLTFYNIGNNHLFHAPIWQMSRRHPGIVILHDFCVHNFFESLYRGEWHDVAGYLTQIEFYYGEEGLRAASEFVNSGAVDIDTMAERYPLTPLALENCLGVVVHTQETFEQLERVKRWPVVYAPLPRSLPAQHRGNEQFRSNKVRTIDPPYRLIMFGYMGRNRRIHAVLEAFSELPERYSFRLDIFGEIADSRTLRSRIRRLNLDGLVQLHGYTPEVQLNAALSAAHLAINLRYPTMGEASGSQLRIWYHALPSLVTDVGWYSSLSDETVAHVRPEYEVADIQAHLRNFLKQPARFARMGEQGLRTLVQLHDPKLYAQTILNLASNARLLRLRKAAYDLAWRAGGLMGSLTSGNEELPRRVAEKIYELTQPQ